MSKELKYLNALNSIPHIGAVTLRSLKERFGSYEAAWHASEAALAEVAGLGEVKLRAIAWKRPSLNPDRELERLVRNEIWVITEEDETYPTYLREIPQPPVIIYGRGAASALTRTPHQNKFGAGQADANSVPSASHEQTRTPQLGQSPSAGQAVASQTEFRREETRFGTPDQDRREQNSIILAVVGTRKPTHYGLEAAEKITFGLARAGVTIVSGLAIGIDARAHEAALDAGGKTIAVLGSGIDRDSIYPPENKGLARRIVEAGGAVISEYAPGTPSMRDHFPARNRIISGLSRGVLVVEAREKSGALITARMALDQNREVFAVPGSIFSLPSVGPNRLIQEGAKLALTAEDILKEFGVEYNTINRESAPENLEKEEKIILELLEEPLGIDLVKERSGLDTPTIVASLSMLELKGYIKNLGGDTFQRISNL